MVGHAYELGVDHHACWRGSAAERCTGQLKEVWWVGMRFNMLVGNSMAFVRLAFKQRNFRPLDPSDKP